MTNNYGDSSRRWISLFSQSTILIAGHAEFSRRSDEIRAKERALCHRKRNDQRGSTIGMQILRDGTRPVCATSLNVPWLYIFESTSVGIYDLVLSWSVPYLRLIFMCLIFNFAQTRIVKLKIPHFFFHEKEKTNMWVSCNRQACNHQNLKRRT